MYEFRKIFNIDRAIALIAIFISIFLTPSGERYIIGFLLIILILGYFFYYKIKKRGDKPIAGYKRFEKILKSREIKYSFIEYDPFFKRESGEEGGIGFSILKKLFDDRIFSDLNIEPFKDKNNNYINHNWHTIFDDLVNKKLYDIIATPMYETRSRLYSYNISYCLPLFYSDIGLYVKVESLDNDKDNSKDDSEKIRINLTFNDAIERIEKKIKKNDWSPEYLEGEISHLMLAKHIKVSKIKRIKFKKSVKRVYSDNDFFDKLKNVESSIKTLGDFIFMEVFKAEHLIDKHKLKLVNILKRNNLVYPVSFVVRKEETVLRNFMNLRIAELKRNGDLYNIINEEAKDYGIKIDKVEDRFIQTYDFSLIDKKYKENQILFSHNIKKEYDILDKVYGNYVKFQENIEHSINNFPNEDGRQLKVLEIGCGTGITTNIILKSTNKMKVTLLDNDPDMIHNTKENIINVHKYELEYKTSDILEFLDSCNNEEFDIVVSAYTIHNFKNDFRYKLFEKLYKKMSSKSLFINADKYASDNDDERIKALNYRINKFTKHLMKEGKYGLLVEWVSHYINDQSPIKVMKETESKELLENIGFTDITLDKPVGDIEMMAILTARK